MFEKSQRAEVESEHEKSARVPMSKRKRKLEAAMLDVGPSVKKLRRNYSDATGLFREDK